MQKSFRILLVLASLALVQVGQSNRAEKATGSYFAEGPITPVPPYPPLPPPPPPERA